MKQSRAKYILFIYLITASYAFCQSDPVRLYKISAKQFKEGKYIEALNTNINALKLAEKTNDCSVIGYGHMKVGNMYYYLKNRRIALQSYSSALRYLESCHTDTLIHKVYNNMGGVYTELQITDSALFYLNKSLTILRKTKRYTELSRINAVIADLHINTTLDLEKAELFINNAEYYARLSGDSAQKTFAKIKRGDLYSKKKLYNEALKFYKEALDEYSHAGYTEGRLHMLKSIAERSSLAGKKDAAEYYSRLLVLKDSVFKEETAAKIAEYETLYKTEKKENENKALQQENILKQAEINSRNKTIIGLLIGVLLVIILLLWRISVMNLKKKKQELEAAKAIQKEKERISRDLHDNVGGQLSYVLYSLDGITEENKQKREELGRNINESIRSVISNLRETIWAINDEFISVNDISDKLKVYAKNLFRNSKITVTFKDHVKENVRLVPMTGLNIFRISQEVLNNSFKYSEASELKIILEQRDKSLEMVISDNGKGFDSSGSEKGFGLQNIKKRAAESGIDVRMKSEPGKGTTYTLLVHLH